MRELPNIVEAGKSMKISAWEVEFVKTAAIIENTLRLMYSKLRAYNKDLEIPEENPAGEKEIRSSEDAVKLVEEFLDASKSILLLYNEVSFFIQSLANIPKFYARVVYGDKIFDNRGTAKMLKKYGVELRILITPDIPDEKIRDEKSIVGIREDSPATYSR